MRFFTSDLHFGHERIIEFEPKSRPFASVPEMNEGIIEAHNAIVSPDDTVFILGDVAMGKIADSLPLVGRLNGYKILVPGNHDRVFSGVKPGMRERFEPEYRKVFDEIWAEQSFISFGNVGSALMCHFPYGDEDHTEDARYEEMRPEDNGLPLVHGHIHGLRRVAGRQFNVGIDASPVFGPTSEEEIAEWIRGL